MRDSAEPLGCALADAAWFAAAGHDAPGGRHAAPVTPTEARLLVELVTRRHAGRAYTLREALWHAADCIADSTHGGRGCDYTCDRCPDRARAERAVEYLTS